MHHEGPERARHRRADHAEGELPPRDDQPRRLGADVDGAAGRAADAVAHDVRAVEPRVGGVSRDVRRRLLDPAVVLRRARAQEADADARGD
eukprot:31083-Pelagococcus_subviridis.AAC.4